VKRMRLLPRIGRLCRPGVLCKGVAAALLLLLVLLYSVPLPLQKLSAPQAYRFFDRHGRLVNLLISADGYFRMRVPVSKISPLFIKTLLLYEDRHFYRHFGVNPAAIGRAVWDNLFVNRRRVGGSTITMQLARMLERRPRTYWAKFVESFRALQLELRYSKEEILAHYLSIAPYGGNIEGLEAAAQRYFGKSAKYLSIGETALLVSIPRSPNTLRPDLHPRAARKRRDKILSLMLAHKLISADQYQRARREPVQVERVPAVNLIPHTAWRHRLKHPRHYQVGTTIDAAMQRLSQDLVRRYLKRVRRHHITNAAVVVIDNRTREVRALVGSSDFFSRSRLGFNDGTMVPRSPGSTLKPFVYALALQRGLVSEKTVLYDFPVQYAGYAPQNYDKRFNGLVTVREALKESLNTVVVTLYKRLGVESLYDLLKAGGITTLTMPAREYGLPLVLGGVEVRLLELTSLYTVLANQGVYRPYRLFTTKTPRTGTGRRLLSREASWIVTSILTDVERPDFPASWQFSRHRQTIAWKTGTSYGNRDAWSIGYTKKYTIGVWLGNFDGSPSKGLLGRYIAAPLLFELFQGLQPGGDRHWFVRPPGVKQREVCALTGQLPTRFCPHRKTEYYIATGAGPVKQQRCTVHQRVLARTDKGSVQLSSRVYEVWPPRLARFLYRHGSPVDQVPAYDLKHMTGELYYKPVIVSPRRDTVYIRRIDKFSDKEHGIRLSGAVTNRVRRVSWFLDNKLIRHARPYEDIIINPKPGTYVITLMDDVGGIARLKLKVTEMRHRQGRLAGR